MSAPTQRNRWLDPDPEIGSKAFLALLCLACVVGFLLVALAVWIRG